MDGRIWYAKSKNEDGYQETNKDHLKRVSDLAYEFGLQLGCANESRLCGQIHDFGKYSEAFQEVLKGVRSGVDHAVCAAMLMFFVAGQKYNRYPHIIEAIGGHHDGLVSYHDLKLFYDENKTSDCKAICFSGKVAALNGVSEYSTAVEQLRADFPDFGLPRPNGFIGESTLVDMLHTRMLFSCLVDADYTMSADPFYSEEISKRINAESFLVRLESYRSGIRSHTRSSSNLNIYRDKLYERCGIMGEQPQGLYTLTAPTGTGKTLALINFALRHCARHEKRRIIVVLPFLTLAEQTAEVYSNIIPNILIDHSLSNHDNRAHEQAQRWDAPFIITTSVKFFESLFSDSPGECRKLHNIADSVVIFDEAQSLPVEVAASTVKAVNSLTVNYSCTVVFSTATPPEFSALPDTNWKPVEIIDDSSEYYRELKRTKVVWRLKKSTPLNEIAFEMAQLKSVCVIVNLKRHAQTIYSELKLICPQEELFYLTTDLCPAHRRKVVSAVKKRLSEGFPCRLVATQCIEAGVDLDFETMYRALAPLEAIIQAAGRCNRSGKLEMGLVNVFEPDDSREIYPGTWYRKAAMHVKEIISSTELDIHNPAHIARYYRGLFAGARERPELTRALEGRCYSDVDSNYKLIEKDGVCVIVPYAESLELYAEVCTAARNEGLTASIIRRAAPISVSTFNTEAAKSVCESVYFRSKRGKPCEPSDFFILPLNFDKKYKPDIGLDLSAGNPIDFMI